MDTGPFFSGTIQSPAGMTLKGLVLKVGEQAGGSLCYDTDLWCVSGGWTDGFLQFNPARFGLISPPAVLGTIQFQTAAQPGVAHGTEWTDPRSKPFGPLPAAWTRYRGLYQYGDRVVLEYTVGEALVRESPWFSQVADVPTFTREFDLPPAATPVSILIGAGGVQAELVQPVAGMALVAHPAGGTVLRIEPHAQPLGVKVAWAAKDRVKDADVWKQHLQALPPAGPLSDWLQGGAPRWTEKIVTRGELSTADETYVVDTLTLPFDNPYHALFFPSGHDFFANGTAAVCTVHGDVWLVSGIDEKLQRLEWRRFATGLHQPLGLKIVQETIYVLGRNQITRLHDLNHDGEADFYENFNNQGQITANGHEYATCLETDSRGNFYYLRGDSGSATDHDGCLLQVSPDGSQLSVFATGFRNANGLGIGPRDVITVAPQEGNWTPASGIFEVQQGGFYGAMQAHHRAQPPTKSEPPLCWLPRRSDNSSGGQVWAPAEGWGPLSGQLLHFSFGTCRMFQVVRETVEPQVQGGSVMLPLEFASGVMRGRFHPRDGQLYVTGLKGWVSSAVQDGCFQRVRYTGRDTQAWPVRMRTWANGVELTFSAPLDAETASDPERYSAEAWNYHWSADYGSPELKYSDPQQIGRDSLPIRSATLSADGRSIFLELPDLSPVNQLAITYDLLTKAGQPQSQTFVATLNVVPKEQYPAEKIVRRSSPFQLADEVRQRLQRGLQAAFQRGDQNERLTSRMAAFAVAAGEPVTTRCGPGAFQVEYSGWVQLTARAPVRWNCVGSGHAELKIDQQTVWSGELSDAGEWSVPAVYSSGYHTLHWTCNSPADGAARGRVEWQVGTNPKEALPPAALWHLPADGGSKSPSIGQRLFAELGCGHCHLPGSTPQPAVWRNLSTAPRWADLKQRVTPGWLLEWLLDPHALRPTARMPRLFDDKERQAAADVVAALLAQPGETAEAHAALDGDAERGGATFEALGCLACHHLVPLEEPDDRRRLSLQHVGQKFLPGQLARFLLQPGRHFPETRMPDFQLDAATAADLEAYLRSETDTAVELPPELATASIERGQRLLQQRRCVACHAPADVAPRSATIAVRHPEAGCLSAVPGTAPRYVLADEELQALRNFCAERVSDLAETVQRQPSVAETSRVLVDALRCQNCHDRDGRSAPLRSWLAEEGSGLPAEIIPDLTWAGEKLWPDWTGQLLAGRVATKTRPWLKARMPAFPQYAAELAQGLSAEHGVSPQRVSPGLQPELAEIGNRLTQKTGGLDCRQCHAVGADLPQGDKGTQFAQGINFDLVAQRLRPDFYQRLVLDPPRYDPSSRMPRFILDGRTSPLKDVFDGDAARQFEAIWQFLVTVQQPRKMDAAPVIKSR